MNNFWIYDIETYKNYFGVIFKNVQTKELREFIVYEDRNDIEKLTEFITDHRKWLIGYNNFWFDNQLLKYIVDVIGDVDYIFGDFKYSSDEICQMIYNLAIKIITTEYGGHKYNLPFHSIDLMRTGNLLNKSLKLVAVNIKWHKIQDLPIPTTSAIKDHNLQLLHDYNLNDVEITEALYHKLIPQLKLRGEVSKMYNVNVLSEPDSGIANRLLEKIYSELTNKDFKEFRRLRTEREIIHFKNVIFNDIVFHTKELQALLYEIKQHTYYKNQKWFNKSIIFDGVKYQLGIGGLHTDDKGDIFEEDNENYLIDCDISSMYPSIIINQALCPAHLDGAFIQKYKEIRDNRLKAKREGREVEADTMKIVLNSVYGKTKFEHHWLYDPLVALQVTMNGQLYLLMLIEDLVRNKFQVISSNTDGIVTIVPKKRIHEYKIICADWCKYTGLDLEYTNYKKYIRKDVNNYIAVKTDGSIKEKGDFIIEKPLVKGFDKPIISIALRKYFIEGVPVAHTIREHRDIYDFCIAQKTDKKFVNEFHQLINGRPLVKTMQKSNRYYISTDGGSLYKVDRGEGKIINYCAGKRITIFNDFVEHSNFDKYNIDYSYYISEAHKIIDQIQNPQLKLF